MNMCALTPSHVLHAGFSFLLEVFRDSKVLEEITGLTDLHARTEAVETDWDDEGSDGAM